MFALMSMDTLRLS